MIRWLVVLDDLLEKLIFDVALATRKRRRIAFALAACTAVVFYGVSGLLFVPAVETPWESCVTEPYALGAIPSIFREVARTRIVPAGREAELERALASSARTLDRIVAGVRGADPVPLTSQVAYFIARGASDSLTARGVWNARRGRGDLAMDDWIAVLRLARLVRHGSMRLYEAAAASDAERRAMEALVWYTEVDMTYDQWKRMQAELNARRQEPRTLHDALLGERAAMVRFFEQAHRDAGFDEEHYNIVLSRAIMPLRHDDRARFFDEVRDRFLREMDADIALCDGNRYRAPRHQIETDYLLFLAPFSREHSVKRLTNLLLWSRDPNYAAFGSQLDLTERLARALERVPAPLDLDSI